MNDAELLAIIAQAEREGWQTLNLSEKKLKTIPEMIRKLTNLKILDLSHNQITEIPDAITQLSNLTWLDLGYNQITAIPDAIANLANLTELYLWNNQITAITDAIKSLTKLQYLDLRGNPISIPRDLLAPSSGEYRPSARPILDYYFRVQDPKKSTQIYEAKILIVGEGGSGKTSLANKLIDPDYQLKPETEDISTQGIDILQWEFMERNQQTYKINIWDFGGQEIYHQIHQFFGGVTKLLNRL
jgi:Leucine-rich repeat (LRR) protein